jgi:ribosomal protein S18 acetylase RimI-like enzyme
MEPLRIRRYEDRDHDAVWDLHNLALSEAGAHAGNGPWDEDLHEVERVYLDDRGEFLIGLVDGEIVAMGALRRDEDSRAQITRMRVHPRFQRRGFGHAILERLESRSRELGYATLYLDTTVEQDAAQSFYRAHGYKETARTQLGPFQVILFEKHVRPQRGSARLS